MKQPQAHEVTSFSSYKTTGLESSEINLTSIVQGTTSPTQLQQATGRKQLRGNQEEIILRIVLPKYTWDFSQSTSFRRYQSRSIWCIDNIVVIQVVLFGLVKSLYVKWYYQYLQQVPRYCSTLTLSKHDPNTASGYRWSKPRGAWHFGHFNPKWKRWIASIEHRGWSGWKLQRSKRCSS